MWVENHPEQQKIVENILSYLKAHPHAADSARGIAGWWVKQPLHKVLPALEFLVAQQVIERLEIGSGHIYRRARSG